MRNIGIVTTWFDRGAAYVSKAYADTLKQEHHVFIYARGGEKSGKDDEYWDNSYVTWGKKIRNTVPSFVDYADFMKWIDKNSIEIVFFNEQQSWDIILKLQKSNLILGTYIDYYTAETVPFFSLFDFLICNTKRHYSVFKDFENCFFVPWGTDTNIYFPKKDFLKDKEQIVFFHSSGMNPNRKGTDIVINAFRKVECKEIKLIIHSQIPLPKDLMNDIIIDKRIELIVGTVKPPGLYHLTDIYLYPTRLDGIGLTIMEALASGLPVVTTDNPPMNEFVIQGVNGFLIKVNEFHKRSDNYYWDESICDIGNLAEIIQKIAYGDVDINKLSEQSRNYSLDYLNWERNSQKLSGIFGNIKKKNLKSDSHYKALIYEYSHYPLYFINALMRRLRKRYYI